MGGPGDAFDGLYIVGPVVQLAVRNVLARGEPAVWPLVFVEIFGGVQVLAELAAEEGFFLHHSHAFVHVFLVDWYSREVLGWSARVHFDR